MAISLGTEYDNQHGYRVWQSAWVQSM